MSESLIKATILRYGQKIRNTLPPAPTPVALGTVTDQVGTIWTLYTDGSVLRVKSNGTEIKTNFKLVPPYVLTKLLGQAEPKLRDWFIFNILCYS